MTLEEARAAGLKSYDSGHPCPKGHSGRRLVSRNACTDCVAERGREYRMRLDPEVARQRRKLANRKWSKAHPDKINENNRRWRERNLERSREINRKAVWKRNGVPPPTKPRPDFCECCGQPPSKKGLHNDHDHESGKFRGWLCSNCNTGIGKLGDSIAGLERAIAYLRSVLT